MKIIRGKKYAIASINEQEGDVKLQNKGFGSYCDDIYLSIEKKIKEEYYDTIICHIKCEIDISTLLSALQLRDKYKAIAVIAVLGGEMCCEMIEHYKGMISKADLVVNPY